MVGAQRRDRLKAETKIAKDNEEHNAILREELEKKRIEIINEEAANKMKLERKESLLKKKTEREWVLERRRDLQILEKKKEIAETQLVTERKKVFDKYLNKVQKHVERESRSLRGEEKRREDIEGERAFRMTRKRATTQPTHSIRCRTFFARRSEKADGLARGGGGGQEGRGGGSARGQAEGGGEGGERAKRASLVEDEHTRDESTPAKWLQTS